MWDAARNRGRRLLPVAAARQAELTANPGGGPGHPRFALTLATSNRLAALADATSSGGLPSSLCSILG